EGAVDTLGELICPQTASRSGITGLTPFGRVAFAVTCESGVVARITGPEADGLRRGAPVRPGPGPADGPP
ncbi:MAG: hypothetical protein JWP97_3121, partial [Labilithrix sp.]|nr:hypothetical protein [Labilithrix sp.]